MTLFRRGDVWWYEFTIDGQRHRGSTKQREREDAELVEADRRRRLRQEAAGIATFDPKRTPSFSEWASIALQYQRRFIGRPDVLERTLRAVLEFWGAKPRARKAPAVKRTPRGASPYHDLRLGDPIARPQLIMEFERWMTARGISGSTRNSYLSACSTLYTVAMQPQYRAASGVASNPFRDIRRSAPRRRVIALEPEQVIAWIRCASYHVALAATIAALAPKLRLRSILELRWDRHIDKDFSRIVLTEHKTARVTGAPQITPISAQLRAIFRHAHGRAESAYVITFRGKPVADIKTGTQRAAKAAGLQWGHRDGVTFHTLRHSIATLLAKMGLPERIRMETMGHANLATTQIYTHLAAATQVEPHEQLSAALPLQAIVTAFPLPKAKRRA